METESHVKCKQKLIGKNKYIVNIYKQVYVCVFQRFHNKQKLLIRLKGKQIQQQIFS